MLTKDKSFYKNFFRLLIILAFQNMIVLSVNLIDNIMIGNFSEDALAGVTAVNQIQFLFQQLLLGTGDTLVVLGSQYWGQKRTEPVKRLLNGGLTLGLGIGLVLFILATFIPDKLMMIFTKNEAYIAYGVEYLRTIRFTYPIFAISSVLLSSLKSVETVKIAFTTSVVSLFINFIVNYLLIFGNFGLPRMGVTGAAIGTLIARVVELAMILIFIFRMDKKLNFKLKDFFTFDKQLTRDYFKNCVSFVVVGGLFGLSTGLQTVILGHLDDGLTETMGSAIAANSISSTLYMMLKVAAIGAASSAAMIIGQTVGRNEIEKVKEYAKTLQLIFIGIGLLTSITLFFLRIPILSLYEISDETRALANSFILVLCVTCIGTSYQFPTIGGIIRGGGDASFVLKNDIISIWGIVLPVSFLGAFVFHWPPVVLVFCLNADQIFKCGAACIKVNRFNWMKKLTRNTTQAEEKL